MQKNNATKSMTGTDLARFFRKSHIYIGLVLAPILILMGATGIILNHTAEFGQNPFTAKIHAGLITGGRSIIDIVGAVLIYLSASGVYLWAHGAKAKAKKKSSSTQKAAQSHSA